MTLLDQPTVTIYLPTDDRIVGVSFEPDPQNNRDAIWLLRQTATAAVALMDMFRDKETNNDPA